MVASAKQIRANRKNAKKGGVKTQEGKNKSKMNALQHGILSEAIVLPGEDVEYFIDFNIELHRELQPQGQLEEFLVERIMTCMWRLRRVLGAEAYQILRYYRDHMADTNEFPEYQVKRWAENSFFNNSGVDIFLRYETTIERQMYRALDALIEVRMARTKYKEIGITTNEPQIV